MKAIVFSIGEKTTPLCAELMERYGFDVEVWQDDSPLWRKLERLYDLDEDLVRVDADIIPNEEVTYLPRQTNYWWLCASGWDWYANAVRPISIHFIKRQALAVGRKHIKGASGESRPETYIWRKPEMFNPRRCKVIDGVMGLHGYGQKDFRDRIKNQKSTREQYYDWDLVERIEAL